MNEMSDEYGYFDDPDPNTIWDESMNYGDDDYQEDEWYEDEPVDFTYSLELSKADNGQLYLSEVRGYRYRGQDWGEAEFVEQSFSLKQAVDELREAAVKHGRNLKPGESLNFTYWDEDEDEAEEAPDDDLPF
jgi:hypothetical protein